MRKRISIRSPEKAALFAYFTGLIAAGSLLLSLPFSWSGAGNIDRVKPVDAFFTSVSAVCVTGLNTVDTSLWSIYGKVIILLLIQLGGLGIVAFGMLYLVIPKAKLSLRNRKLIKDSFIIEHSSRSRQIIKGILSITFITEGLGAVLLFLNFRHMEINNPVFTAIFHSVSAFCNAGFSTFPDGLVRFRPDILVNFIIMALIITGGIGFIVIMDLIARIRGKRRSLFFHTKFMLAGTVLFISAGFIGYLLLDTTNVFRSLPPGERFTAALFQSVTTRTAGFNTVDQSSLSLTSRWLTLSLMLVGGGSGSTAGGIKVSTALILLLVLFKGLNDRGNIKIMKRKITSEDISRAAMFFMKAVTMLFLSIFFLGIIEAPSKTGFTPAQIVFESVSALGTVGLSMGITPLLSTAGKIIIAFTMFAGRVGLFALVMRVVRDSSEELIDYPRGEVLIG